MMKNEGDDDPVWYKVRRWGRRGKDRSDGVGNVQQTARWRPSLLSYFSHRQPEIANSTAHNGILTASQL